jgi:hypothetical protein
LSYRRLQNSKKLAGSEDYLYDLLSFHTTLQSFEIIYKSVALASLISRKDILNSKVVLLLKNGAVFYLRGRRPGEKVSRRLISYLGA